MNPPWRLGLFADTGYEVLWEDAERIFCKTWRVGVAGDRQVVLAVLYAEEHPSPENLSRLAHEYALRDELDGAWAARPLELDSRARSAGAVPRVSRRRATRPPDRRADVDGAIPANSPSP